MFDPCFIRQYLVPALELNHLAEEESIRIYHECEGRIEKSFPTIVVGITRLVEIEYKNLSCA